MIIKLILNKETGKACFDNLGTGNAKIDIIDYNDNYVFLKQGGYSGYVHRGIGVTYTGACYQVCKLIKINNYKDEVEFIIDYDLVKDIPVKNVNQRILEKVKELPIQKRPNPLDSLSPKDREIIERNLKEQKALMDSFSSRVEKEN